MKKLKSLEGLRGLAALAVVIFHFLWNFFPASITGLQNQVHFSNNIELLFATTPLNLFYNGNFAVCIFFVLSGFVLSIKFFKTQDNQVVTATAFKRYFRLAIPALFSLIPFYLLAVINPVYSGFPNIKIINVLYEGLFGSFTAYKASYNSVLWTMTYEFFGSFLVFGSCMIFGHNRNRFFAYLFLLLMFWRSYYIAFCIGIFLCDLYVNQGNYLKNSAFKIVLFILAIFLGSYPNTIGLAPGSIGIQSTMYSFLNFGSGASVVYHNLGATFLILVILNSQLLDKFFSQRIFQFLGKISFSLYLMHAFIIAYLSPFIFNYFSKEFLLTYKVNFLVTFIISLVIIFIITYYTYKFVDQSAIKFSEFMYKTVFIVQSENRLLDLKFLKKKLVQPIATKSAFLSQNPIDDEKYVP